MKFVLRITRRKIDYNEGQKMALFKYGCPLFYCLGKNNYTKKARRLKNSACFIQHHDITITRVDI